MRKVIGKKRGCFVKIILFFMIGLVVMPLLSTTGLAADEDLARQYAPIFYFEAEETCFPVDISYHVDASYLYQIVDDEAQLVTATPSEADLSFYSSDDYYLDNQQGTVDDVGIITDYQSKLSTLGYTVYARVVSDGGYTLIQYWLFYAFNKGELNQHEGDWEMVQLVLSGNTPEQVMYSQHYSGQQTTWEQVERTGDHMHVYVARGSHANYFRYYSGKLGAANDYVGANGRVLQPTEYSIELLESQPWLSYAGRWGWAGADEAQVYESMFLGQLGPQGPMYRAEGGYSMWEDPLTWGASLGQLDNNLSLVELLLYHFV
ncbi:MAG: Vps62-related protein, partial [Candidatus Thermoplasmatota archaeon]|nr:Vps62-related protein [Candidatus Thermoplasmatota archaeon]